MPKAVSLSDPAGVARRLRKDNCLSDVVASVFFSGYQIVIGIKGIRLHGDRCFMRGYMKWNITYSLLDTAGNAFHLVGVTRVPLSGCCHQ